MPPAATADAGLNARVDVPADRLSGSAVDTVAPDAGAAAHERLQQLFRHTLREHLPNPLLDIVLAHRMEPAP